MFGADPFRRQNRAPVFLFDTQYHITAAQVMEVVGKGADRMQHTLRIPPGLVLDAFALDGALAKQMVKVDRKFARHAVALARRRLLRSLAL